MDSYFSRFPTIDYNGFSAKNIMLRTKLINRVYDDPKYFYSVDVRNGIRADTVAYEAYDDQYLSWLVYLANGTMDPYYQWGLSQYDFDNHIESKYNSIANAQGRVAFWQNNWYNTSERITIDTYNVMADYDKQYYEPVLTGNRVLEYRRKQLDWTVNTNEIWEYVVDSDITVRTLIADGTTKIFSLPAPIANVNDVQIKVNNIDKTIDTDYQIINDSLILTKAPAYDEKVQIKYNLNDAKITITDANTSIDVANGQLLLSNSTTVRIQHVFGEANTANGIISSAVSNATIQSIKLLARNIPIEHRVYWSPVTYYDLEAEKNANKSNIRLLSREHTSRAALELKRLLNP